jgi:hypothetical protein
VNSSGGQILPDNDHEMPEGSMPRPEELMAGDYYDERELAEALGRVIRTLRSWRSRGDGPPYLVVGRRVF